MMLDGFNTISKSTSEPIYQQIKSIIQQRIINGDWPAGYKLPSENELVVALDVSRMTINRSLRELTQEGLIKRVHGLGSFVTEAPRHASLIELQDIALEIEQDGRRHCSKILALNHLAVSEEIADLMQLPLGSSVFHLSAVHFKDDIPIQHESRYVNPTAIPAFGQQDFTRMTATAYLLKQFKPDEMEHRVCAVMPNRVMRKLLSMSGEEPCLQLKRRTWNNDQVVTCVTLTYPGDRYELAARYATNEYQLR